MARKKPPRKRSRALAAPRPASLPAVLDPRSAAQLIPPAEIERLKMVVLTSVDPGAKIEALRKLALAPIPDSDRGVLYLRALTDSEPAVRREAADLLRTLGMSAEFAEALGVLAAGPPRQKSLALDKIAATCASRPAAERSVSLAVLHSMLESETDIDVRAAVLRALVPHADLCRGRRDAVESILRAAVRAAADNRVAVGDAARALFAALAAVEPDASSRTLWREAVSIQDPLLRGFVYSGAFAGPPPADLVPEMAARLAQEVRAVELDRLEFRSGIEAFGSIGDPALDALLKAYEGLSEVAGISWVGLVDTFAHHDAMTPAARGRAVLEFLRRIDEAARAVRLAILDSRILYHASLAPDIRRRVAQELILHLHVFHGSRGADLARSVILRLGADAIDAILEALRSTPYEEEREEGVDLIAELCSRSEITDARRGALLDALHSQEAAGRIPPGRFVRAAGRIAQSIRDDRARVAAVITDLRRRSSGTSYAADSLVALCTAVAGPATETREAVEVALQTLDFVMGPLPDTPMGEEDSPEGKRLVIGQGTRVYTEVIPALLQGLLVVYRSGHLHGRTRAQLLRRLEEKWDAISSYEEVWAPANLIELARTLAGMARCERGDSAVRIEVLDRLRRSIRNISIVQIVADLCGDAEMQDDDYARRMGELVGLLFRMLSMGEYAEAGDRQSIIEALARIATSARIGTDESRSEETRRRIVEAVIELEPLDWRAHSRTLDALATCPAIPTEWKERVKRRRARGMR